MDEDIKRVIAEAVYNGVCLAAENGLTEAYDVRGVVLNEDTGRVVVALANGKIVAIEVSDG